MYNVLMHLCLACKFLPLLSDKGTKNRNLGAFQNYFSLVSQIYIAAKYLIFSRTCVEIFVEKFSDYKIKITKDL